jgi:methylmalonyl-CoA mutase cobalamin-binding subunit
MATGPQVSLNKRILMAPAPEEQHTFGMNVASEYLLRAGFDVDMLGDCSLPGLVQQVRSTFYDAVGLSLGSVRHSAQLTRAIKDLRRRSQNPSVAVVVGGPLFGLDPDLVDVVGADLFVPIAIEAPEQILHLLAGQDTSS